MGVLGEDGKGKCTLGRGSGLPSQESVSVLLSKHIVLVNVYRPARGTLCHYFQLQLRKNFGGMLECLGEKLPPTPQYTD